MGNVITVLAELVEKIDGNKLRDVVKLHREVIVAQRLGYLLDMLRRQDLSKLFIGMVKEAPWRRLEPTGEAAGAGENRKWRLLVNARLEPEA